MAGRETPAGTRIRAAIASLCLTDAAARIGLPILYLSSAASVSRQIQGTPAAITAIACDNDSAKLAEQVTTFLHQWRSRIEDGPRRRDSRRLRMQPLASRLREKWDAAQDRTGIAARCNLEVRLIELTLADPARLAMLSADAVVMLCAELGISFGTPAAQLSIPATPRAHPGRPTGALARRHGRGTPPSRDRSDGPQPRTRPRHPRRLAQPQGACPANCLTGPTRLS